MSKYLKIQKLKKFLKNNWILLAILVGAFVLRIFKIDHGYPYIYNFDEPTIVRSTQGLFFDKRINHFDWPHFNYYLNFVIYFVFIKARALLQILDLRDLLEGRFPVLWNDPFVFYALSRSFNALLSSLTIIPVYLLARAMFSKKAGLYSALIFAVVPYIIILSHLASQDILLLFMVSWGLYFSYLSAVNPSIKNAILAGIFYGFSAGAKYNGVLFLISIPIFYSLCREKETLWNLKKLFTKTNIVLVTKLTFIATLTGLFIFLLTNPEVVLNWKLFWSHEYGRGFLWQLKDNADPLSLPNYLISIPNKLVKIQKDMGMTLGVLSFIGIVGFYKYDKKNFNKALSLIIISAVFFLFTARYGRAGSHYFFPIYGLIVVFFGGLISVIKNNYLRYLMIFLFIIVPLVQTLSVLAKYQKGSTLSEAMYYYEMAKSNNTKIYYKGGSFGEANIINNLHIKKYREETILQKGDVLISEEIINSDKIKNIGIIKKEGRFGPTIYVYTNSD